ncbi:membrane-associated PAP2 superfamily phosphatase [Rhodobium orientis]|uniref:Phosphatidic acid phosphatase type 2/haloperoxidase domain-containing protein n=1 Tax=Rhodobium orientis TaxID=34017 RepID=A0A327JSR0_9HYPH|nr:phosphatase PAP2 family protein [Rhodobium orientis]MBB4303704.1 membrane-associated PAP2 superfamily phosphatase [Rhodobium orientis]MBK5951841.1 hypothetical protein [Rhodobium orientis]RAI28493.1 hypothetical protein CH339_06295 [Rhodobium orientis]
MRTSLATAVSAIAQNPLRAAVIATALLSLFFLLLPDVDIAVSRLFYEPGAGFPLADVPFLQDLRALNRFLMRLIGVCAGGALLAWMLIRRLRARFDVRAPVFLLSTLALGPWLMVNIILKGYWGRARPVQTDVFGGESPFSNVWQIVDHCQTNCSFTSGEAASAAWLFALVFIAPVAWRRTMSIGIGLFAVAASFNRILFGGHFLSDVLLSWTLIFAVLLLLRWVIYKRPPKWLERPRLEAALARAGDAVVARSRRAAGKLRAARKRAFDTLR